MFRSKPGRGTLSRASRCWNGKSSIFPTYKPIPNSLDETGMSGDSRTMLGVPLLREGVRSA